MKKIIAFLYTPALTIILLYSTGCSEKENHRPAITSVIPSVAHGGDTLTAYGRNLFSSVSTVSISTNKKTADIILSTSDSLKVVVPEMAGSGKVMLNIGDEVYEGPEFTYKYVVVVSTVAGTGVTGNADGSGENASFNCPWGVTADNNGDLLVADCYNRLIRKIAVTNNMVSTFTIPPTMEGGNFYSPYNIALHPITQDAFITDFNEHLMKMDKFGNMSVIYTGSMPLTGIGVSPDGNHLFVTNNTSGKILKMNKNGQNAIVHSTGLITPRNIFFDSKAQMFVSACPYIYRIKDDGTYTPVVRDPELAGWEAVVDTAGNFYIADHFKNRIRKITPLGNVTTIAGNGIAADIDGIGTEASFDGPQGIAIDAAGNLYVTTYNYDSNTGNKVRKISFR